MDSQSRTSASSSAVLAGAASGPGPGAAATPATAPVAMTSAGATTAVGGAAAAAVVAGQAGGAVGGGGGCDGAAAGGALVGGAPPGAVADAAGGAPGSDGLVARSVCVGRYAGWCGAAMAERPSSCPCIPLMGCTSAGAPGCQPRPSVECGGGSHSGGRKDQAEGADSQPQGATQRTQAAYAPGFKLPTRSSTKASGRISGTARVKRSAELLPSSRSSTVYAVACTTVGH
mmetsp:Transcript_46928/g.87368  ORF Transcript_46928/g.87368 Transcript_46928/m.87368 type:complete len:230 (-) Transcript_46928:570-1259(-)